MRKLKKVIKYIVIIILTIEIISLILTPKEIKKFQSATKEEREEMLEKEYEDFLDGTKYVENYYDTVEEAVKDGGSVDIVDIYEILKVVEVDDNYVILGPSRNTEGMEEFSVSRLKTKIDENGEKKYSNIISASSMEFDNFSRKGIDDKILIFPNFVATNKIKRVRHTSRIILEKYPRFAWSISALEDIKYLEIQGKKPDEVIPFEMAGKTFYFYYYEDLKTEGKIKEEDFVINKDGERK